MFRHQRLAKGEIRFLRLLPESTPSAIRCRLVHRTLNESGPFIALSYCWGDSDARHLIQVDGLDAAITTNLCNALQAIVQHHESDSLFWIDALCIDQHDVEEKNEQVALMWQIYSTASKVYSWLGAEDDEMQDAFRAIRTASAACHEFERSVRRPWPCTRPPRAHAQPCDRDIAAVGYLLDRPYFDRAWIYQEFINAREVFLVSGRLCADWHLLWHFVGTVFGLTMPRGRLNLFAARKRSAAWDKIDRGSDWHKKFIEILRIFHGGQCTDKRDRIFAMLGDQGMRFINPGQSLKPDYGVTTCELAVIVMNFYDGLLRMNEEDSGTAEEELATLLPLLSEALEVSSDAGFFASWINDNTQTIQPPDGESAKRRLPSGTFVDCSGPLMAALLSSSKSPREQLPAG